jgi:hypothetical protein
MNVIYGKRTAHGEYVTLQKLKGQFTGFKSCKHVNYMTLTLSSSAKCLSDINYNINNLT